MRKDVVFLGCRGYSHGYGGWETLIRNVIDNWQDPDVHFYVFELVHDKDEAGEYIVNGVTCIRIYIETRSHFEMIFCDYKALKMLKKIKERYSFENPILYVMGARIGGLFWVKQRSIKKMGYILVHNPAGLEWKRESNPLIALYVYISHKLLANACNYIICDCYAMQHVYEKICPKKKTDMCAIHYGTYEQNSEDCVMNPKAEEFFHRCGITPRNYYLIINRFVRENSYELILKEFVKSKTDADFVVVSNIDKENKIYSEIAKKVPFENDNRIKFVGTVYDTDILKVLRSNARGYINGHTLGGTNPGLLESLATTDVNLVRDCVFSREGAENTAFYFDEYEHPLSELLMECDALSPEDRHKIGEKAKNRMKELFSWEYIADCYDKVFLMLFEKFEYKG